MDRRCISAGLAERPPIGADFGRYQTENAVTGHGQAMKGGEMRNGLNDLSRIRGAHVKS
jgi:hypothetical protein